MGFTGAESCPTLEVRPLRLTLEERTVVPVTAWAVPLVARVSLCAVAVLEERAWELLVTAEEELLLELEERACEPLLTEELPDERVVTLLERVLLVPLERVELPLERVVVLVPLERVVVLVPLERVVVLVPLDRVACWLLLLLERLTCELLLPLERELEELPEERVTCWLLPEERVLELERLLEELLELPVERVVVEPPPERDWASISGAVSMDSAITNEAA